MRRDTAFRRILYATNLGDKMRPVFRYAIDLARTHHAKIVMLHVVAPIGTTAQTVLSLYLPEAEIKHLQEEKMDDVISVMKNRLANYCAQEEDICKGDESLVTDTVVLSGNPGQSIVSYAEDHEIDLIVLGSHARSPASHDWIGSTARHVTMHSKVPVLLIPNM